MDLRPIDEVTFVIFDFETTGLHPEEGDRVCEIGAMKVIGGSKIDEFWTMVDPERPISPGAFRVNRITPAMLQDAPRMGRVMPAFLSFIGLGVDPPTPSWGMMIQEGFKAMRSHPHLALFPGIALALVMLSFNFLGDGLRDALDPRMKQ